MKRHLTLAVLCTLFNYSAVAQALYVPYVPVQKAAPPNFSDIDARFTRESQVNADFMQQELVALYKQHVMDVSMLPLRKKSFQIRVDSVFKDLGERAATARYMDGAAGVLNSRYRQKFNSIFDASLIQFYKEEYRRVKEWETYLRDKNALDASYKNGTQPTGLTNREVISILYSTDQLLFDKVN